MEKGYPAVVTDLGHLTENTKKVTDWCAASGIFVAGVIKGASGRLEVAKAMVDGGVKMIASSRLEQLKRCKDGGIEVPLLMIRVPMISETHNLVRIADYSLNSELDTLRALNEAVLEARKSGDIPADKKHKVVLMADLGDLREGWFNHDELVQAAITVENDMEGLELAGVGTNLGCYGSVMPTEDKMNDLAGIASRVEEKIGRSLEIVSGGATSSLMGVFDGYMPEKINMLRVGAGILTGPLEDIRTAYGYEQMEEMHDDCFTLEAEVIEVKKKATHPIGKLGVDAFGNKPEYVDRGDRMRMLLAIGRADYGDIGDLVPVDKGIEVIGASGDHTIVDIEDAEKTYHVGDIVKFKLKYSAIMRLTTSENVKERSK